MREYTRASHPPDCPLARSPTLSLAFVSLLGRYDETEKNELFYSEKEINAFWEEADDEDF